VSTASVKGMPPQASASQANSFSKPALPSCVSKFRATSSIEGPIGAIGDAGDAAFQPPRVGRLAVLEGGSLHPRGVESFT